MFSRRGDSVKKMRGFARVQVLLEIETTGGSWGHDCSLDQLYRQARENVLGQLNCVPVAEGARQKVMPLNWRVIDVPKIAAILVEES